MMRHAQIDRVLRSNIKLRHLQLVVALDEFRHLGRTAEFLSVSQPAVSKMLSEVESMLGAHAVRPLHARHRADRQRPRDRALRAVGAGRLRAHARRDRAVESGAAGRTRVGSMVVALPVLLAAASTLLKKRSAQATVLVEEGDLTRLLPKLRLGELDLFVGRLEPGYAAPDLVTERCSTSRWWRWSRRPPLARRRGPAGATSRLPCVLPPPWASLRVKLEQQFHKHGLQPPTDLVETASFLAIRPR
jgi:DNA-binding transcriptional LysR family regulator